MKNSKARQMLVHSHIKIIKIDNFILYLHGK